VYVTAIIAAGGRGARVGAVDPKQFLPLGGRPLLSWSVDTFLRCTLIDDIVIALPAETAADPPPYLGHARVRIVDGGERRQDSVARACALVRSSADVVLVHDAARPFVSEALVTRVVEAAAQDGAAIAALAARDTVKRASATGYSEETLPRETIYLAQTPQAFRLEVLRAALAAASGDTATDEAALVERTGQPVKLVEGDPRNLKITTREDFVMAESMLAGAAPSWRIGHGYDLHRLAAGRRLVLGGVTIPFDRGLLAHSDGDVVCHAVTDAVLGAAGAGDIGRLFPDTDPVWKDADSIGLLSRAVAVVREAGFRIGSVDVTVIAERPKLQPHVAAMRERLAGALAVEPSSVSVKGKTNEGVDAIGAGDAIAAHAVALVWLPPPARP